jgi:hypothetical protein
VLAVERRAVLVLVGVVLGRDGHVQAAGPLGVRVARGRSALIVRGRLGLLGMIGELTRLEGPSGRRGVAARDAE